MGLNITDMKAALLRSANDRVTIEAKSGQMLINGNSIDVSSSGKILVPNITLTGDFSDYNRDKGYPESSTADFSLIEVPIELDKSIKLRVDKKSEIESGLIASANKLMKKVFAEKYIPMVDKYNFSHAFKAIDTNGITTYSQDYTSITGKELMENIILDISNLRDERGATNLICYMSGKLTGKLSSFTLEKYEYKNARGEVYSVCKMIDGVIIVGVPSDRFKTAYDASYKNPAEDAKDINYMILNPKAPCAIQQFVEAKIIGHEVNQMASASDITLRVSGGFLFKPADAEICCASVKQTKSVSHASDTQRTVPPQVPTGVVMPK